MFFLLLLACYHLCFVSGALKSSLVFVIDDTGSMYDEIRQVKDKTYEVFDAVLSSNASMIDDFVLVTFNDPGTKLRIITRDRDKYKHEVESIRIGGGGDCPEMSMTGIELALENSKPNSFLYVYTDASAKDYNKFERVKSLSQKKSTQVSFLLTGMCGDYSDEDFRVFDKLSAATSGQVFHLEKDDVHKIIDYIITSIKDKKTTLGQRSFGSGHGNKLELTLDSKTWDTIISVSSDNPNFRVTDSKNNEVATIDLISTSKTKMAKLNAKPGPYTVVLSGSDPSSVKITASTSVTFRHGFSSFKPTSINETSTKPIPDQPSYLSIELDNFNRDVLLKTAEIRDIDDNVVKMLPLQIVDEKQQFYSSESFIPPNFTFKIAINGVTPSGEKVTRIASTTVEYQKPILEITKNLPPTVTIIPEVNVEANYDKPLTIKCKFSGFPKPDVLWVDSSGKTWPSTVTPVDLPYDYMSVLTIDKVREGTVLTCKAVNSNGDDNKSVTIAIKRYFNVLKYPSDITVEYGKQADLKINIEASPPARIIWYKNDEVISNDENFKFSDDNSTLTIKDMNLKLKGNYAVEAVNEIDKKKFPFNVFISGTEAPVIDKSSNSYTIEKGSNVDLSCRVVRGIPKPKFKWFIDRNYSGVFHELSDAESEIYHIDYVDIANRGNYKCKVSNELGEDVHDIKLHVQYPPSIEEFDPAIEAIIGQLVKLPCTVDGSPIPAVSWFFDGVEIGTSIKYFVYKNHTLRFVASPEDIGRYTCEATNFLGKVNRTIYVDVIEPPVIDKSINSYHIEKGANVDLLCRVRRGNPTPKFNWFIDLDYSGVFDELGDAESDNYHIDYVDTIDKGIYRCTASNKLGEDVHDIELHVQYPPSIEVGDTAIEVIKGQLVKLPCTVDGSPIPAVQWFNDGVEIGTTVKYRVYRDHSLSFTASPEDTGRYTCEASNFLGKVNKTIYVDVIVPVDIEPPKKSVIYLTVGSPLTLPCRADGHPKPEIKWTFFSPDPTVAPRTLRSDETNSVTIIRTQLVDEGLYTCVSSNGASTSNITYEVHIEAPPVIKNTLGDKTFRVVKGDLVLRIPCLAIGHPKPTITWIMGNGFNIASGTEWYDIEEDGTLLIKNVDMNSGGTYRCKAENSLGFDLEDYNVVVHRYPKPAPTPTVLTMEAGTSSSIECDLPHRKSDLVRWFKNGKLIANGELYLHNVKISDSGIYSCRVSNFKNSHSSHKRITVGYKPAFTADVETHIVFDEGSVTSLQCEATGQPMPVVQWRKNDVVINETSMVNILFMEADDMGLYTCIVSNVFGSINRTFNVTAKECVLDINNDFNVHQPLLLTSDQKWPNFQNTDGFIRIPTTQFSSLFCPNGFITYRGMNLGKYNIASCVEKSIFRIRGTNMDFKQIRCNTDAEPTTRSTGIPCGKGEAELLKVGYAIGKEFLSVYDVCFNNALEKPVYAKHELSPLTVDAFPIDAVNYTNTEYLHFKFDDMYDCLKQRNSILSLTGKRLSTDNRCCFAKRQLVNSRDVFPGPTQAATYNYLNVVPKWGTCGTENWDEVEQRVRYLVKSIARPLEVWTGSSQFMKLPGQPKPNTVYLTDRHIQRQMVPRYTWKVIADKGRNALAIIQINVPDITVYQAHTMMPCRDICHEIEWMRGPEWRDVTKGFTFCCTIKDFENAFGYKDLNAPETPLKSSLPNNVLA